MMEEVPCPTCEMRASCARDKRCYRPLTLAHWVQEVRDAVAALQAAERRLSQATAGMNAALAREKAAGNL